MTLFISEKNKKRTLIEWRIYLCISAFVALFSVIYESCSHGVYSRAMVFAFLYPLLLGALLYLLFHLVPFKTLPGTIPCCVYNLGVALFTTRSIFIGVLQIYGKTNEKMLLTYTILAIVIYTIGTLLIIYSLIKGNIKKVDKDLNK